MEIPLQISKMMSKNAYLEIFLGSMFSGKTSKLLELYKQYKFCNIPISVINHSADTRYHETMLSSHDKIMIPCIHTNKLMELWELDIDDSDPEKMKNYINLRNAEVILINEAQFFEDLIPCVQSMLKEKKTIYISGLDGDFERKKFGNIIDLILLCDKVTKLSSLCNLCKNGSPGLFSLRLTKEKQQMLIGTDNYIPVCRACYDTNC
jgi:thymidine kinase